jgi:hypothetical protein
MQEVWWCGVSCACTVLAHGVKCACARLCVYVCLVVFLTACVMRVCAACRIRVCPCGVLLRVWVVCVCVKFVLGGVRGVRGQCCVCGACVMYVPESVGCSCA